MLNEMRKPHEICHFILISVKTIPNKRSSTVYFSSLLDNITSDKAIQRNTLLFVIFSIKFETDKKNGLIRSKLQNV